jgi:hypothetical protein
VGGFLCCGVWAWRGLLCWIVTVLWAVGLERIVVLDCNCAVGLERIVVLDGNCAVGCGPEAYCRVWW